MKEIGYTSLSFIELVNIGARLIGLSFFLSVGQDLNWRFSRNALLMKPLELGSKSGLTTNWLTFEILLAYAWFLRCIINVDWNLQHLPKFTCFWRRQVIPIFCLRAFCCVLRIFPYFSALAYCNIDCWFFSMHFNMTSDVCASFKVFRKVMK